MSTLATLSDADLDAVTGGIFNGGNGGNGGTAANGAVISSAGGRDSLSGVIVDRSNLSTNGSTAVANGGRGGDAVLAVRLGR